MSYRATIWFLLDQQLQKRNYKRKTQLVTSLNAYNFQSFILLVNNSSYKESYILIILINIRKEKIHCYREKCIKLLIKDMKSFA